MFARIWWKEARQFWPIWAFVALAAAGFQGLFLYSMGQDARQGVLGLSALAFASLYALAVGAAAFAGERETGTLRLLDILPADRRVVWAGKSLFALVTTLALTVMLLAMAAMSTERWNPRDQISMQQALSFGPFVLVALGCGLFWSAILNNALTAAVVATCSAGLGLTFLSATVNFSDPFLFPWLWQVLLISVTTIASVLIFTRESRPRTVRFALQSPIVVTRTDATSPAWAQLQVQSPVATVLSAAPRPVLGTPDAPLVEQSPRRSWVAEARKLAWQTMKEGRRSWCLLVVIELACLALVFLHVTFVRNTFNTHEPGWLRLIVNIGVGLIAGANVFGLENRSATYRFLNHHGARPRLVWLVKLAVWSAGLALIFSPLLVLAAFFLWRSPRTIEDWYLFWSLSPLLFFAVAQLTGMVIRRGITAVVVALVLGLALAVPQSALVNYQMLPVAALFVPPAVLLAITWAWSGDWLFDRPAPGRWLRLGVLLIGTSFLVAGGYIGYRAWSIPDPGPVPAPAAWTDVAPSPLPAAENAAELYLQAGRRLDNRNDSSEFLNRNRELLDEVRRAAARAVCRFPRPIKPTLVDHPEQVPVGRLGQLVSLDVKEREQRGDLAGAWDGIVVLFRMARHFSEPAGLAQYLSGLSLEQMALGLTMEWAVEREQSPERLLAALTAYREMPKIPPPAEAVRAEANLAENTLDLPSDTFRDFLYETLHGKRRPGAMEYALIDAMTSPWERARTRRVNRLVTRAAIDDASREPWQRARNADIEIQYAEQSTPLARALLPNPKSFFLQNDRNEVARRALVQILAIRVWQLRHGGQFPERLDQLVPEILSSLPSDPYSGRNPFRYIRSNEQLVAPLDSAIFQVPTRAASKGSRLLYSVGYDFRDDGGTAFRADFRTQMLDFVFEIPPVEGSGSAGTNQ